MTLLYILVVLSLIWTAVLVLALVVYLTATAIYLHIARRHIAGIADDLTAAATLCEPLDEKLTSVATELTALDGDLKRVDDGLGLLLGKVSESVVAGSA